MTFPDPEIEANARLNLADIHIVRGKLNEAEEQLRWVERVVREPKPEDRWALWLYSQHFFHSYGELCLLRGELDRARSFADECLGLAERTNRAKNVVKARRLLGEVAIARRELDAAGVELSQALDTAHELGNPPQLWKTLIADGDLQRAHGGDGGKAYTDAVDVIDRVASDLGDEDLRAELLHSDSVLSVRAKAE